MSKRKRFWRSIAELGMVIGNSFRIIIGMFKK